MKILIVDNSAMSMNGGDYFTNSLNGLFVKDLKNCNNSISYFQFVSKETNSFKTFNLSNSGVSCYPLKIYKNKLIRYIIAHFALIRIILKNDFIYFYTPNSLKFGPLICKLLSKKYGLYVRGMKGIVNIISIWNYKKAFTIFTVSDTFTRMINMKTNKKNAHTIKPMIPFSETDIIRDRNYVLKNKLKILFLGRIAHDKGIAELLKAAKILKGKDYNFELNLVGSGEYLQKTKQLINEYNLVDTVIIRGAIFDTEIIKTYYLNADIYVLPTYHEGFPRTLYEAMIFGTPIITTFVGGISAIMKNKWNCLQINPKSVNSIVDSIDFAVKNYDKMATFAMNGIQMVYNIVDSKRPTHGQHLSEIINK